MTSESGAGRAGHSGTAALALRALAPPDGSPPAGDLLVAIDAHPTLRVWRETLDSAVAELRSLGLFERVDTAHLLGSDLENAAGVRLESHPASAGDRHRMLLVITDGLAAGWRSGAALTGLRAQLEPGPTAIIHLLPQPLWFRSGLSVRHLQMRGRRPWHANVAYDWRLREAPMEIGESGHDAEHDVVPLPVLELTERSMRAWATLVHTGSADWREISAVLTPRVPAQHPGGRAEPIESAQPPVMSARDCVSDLRAAASPTAFTLATRLAAAPLSLPVVRMLIAQTSGAGPVHLTELLLSGLLVPVTGAGDDRTDIAFEFAPEIREELLALARRTDTIRVLRDVRRLVNNSAQAAQGSLLPAVSEALDSTAVPTVTRRNLPFLRVELHALQALSGPFMERAEMLAIVLNSYDQYDATPALESGRATSPELPENLSRGESGMPVSPLPPADEGNVSTPRVWGNIPPRNPNFTGRADLLELLAARLREGTTTVLPEALHGMGGVGKTQLAIEYAYRHQSEYDIVWWIPAERPGQIGQALVELAQRLGINTSSEANIAGPAVREALREGKPYSRWLLIFDNAESPERVRHYFPTGGIGTILVTSRNRRWSLVGGSLEVDVFSREESKELLRRSGAPIEDDEADRLAEALGDLPLALEQAAAWRAETGMPVTEYLRLFETKRTELLELSPPLDYQLPVAAAWNVSLDHLETRSLAALRLLQLCSYFAPGPISRAIFSGLGGGSIVPELDHALNDPIRLARALREVNRYSLARIDHRTNSVEMHRLVQAVLINRMSSNEKERMRDGAHTLMAAADPKEPAQPDNWPRYAELYGHVVASQAIASDQLWVRELVMNIAKYLFYWGDWELAVDFCEQAWENWQQRFGQEDTASRRMAWWLCFVYLRTGRHEDARVLSERLREIYESTAPQDGEDDREDAIEALNLVAAVRRSLGEFEAGAELDARVHARALRLYGEDDPQTLYAAHNLAVSLRLTGEFAHALELDQRTHALKVRLFGSDHQQALVTQAGIAIDVRETGDYIRARSLQESVVDANRLVFGATNPATVQAMKQLSEACRKEGDHMTALQLAREAFTEFTRRYGHTHPRSLDAALALSISERQNGDLASALDLGTKACERYRRLFSPTHPHALAADVDRAVTLRLLGRPEEARALDRDALSHLTERLSADHPMTLACAINLSSDLSALGEISEARRLGESTWERCRSALGPDHPTTLACAGNLALDQIAAGTREAGTGEDLLEQTVERLRAVLDAPRLQSPSAAPHPATLQAQNRERANCAIDPMPL
ncbi:FxSxx-COOH system tetratricopeptide repeat protein [Streptomyces sp. bgisy027]|uniref:FxSxx-COOH system tetratricopeptide repeat protein n=1 Tax=Streptomyces sp. bgisy027 TaxID=3413770 RepID=UPI003D717A2B